MRASRRMFIVSSAVLLACTNGVAAQAAAGFQVGPRPAYLIDQLVAGDLKSRLQACLDQPVQRSRFSIGHRGAPLQFPEHTRESYLAAARMGAGMIECDVTFTKDRELVCRHDQCDLHATTNILAIPALAAKCSQGFTPYDAETRSPASARCCTSDLMLAEFKQLRGKMDGVDPQARTTDDFMRGTPAWRTELYIATGTLMTHREAIALFQQLGVAMTPELKTPAVSMPFDGDYTQEAFAEQMLNDYVDAGVPASLVRAQSFRIADILHWQTSHAEFAKQAIALFDLADPVAAEQLRSQLPELQQQGIHTLAPPLWALLRSDEDGELHASPLAVDAKHHGFELITWTLERSGTLQDDNDYYLQGISQAVNGPGDTWRILDALAQKVGVVGVFSDWPATTSYYASCMRR